MKKTYEKPRIYIERLELAEHIATGCQSIMSYGDFQSCTVTDMGAGYWPEGAFAAGGACAIDSEAYCYTNGSAEYGVFTS